MRLAICVPVIALWSCTGPQSTLAPAGPAARDVAALWWGMFIAAGILLIMVVVLWLYALGRRRDGIDSDERTGRRWIVGGGLVLPLISTAILLVFGIPIGHRMLPLPTEAGEPFVIEITGHQWWWEVHYPAAGITTANELYLPAGVPVDFHITSADVIHSFWVPRLGGKIDMVPGRVHVHRLEASEPGSFRGQCSEFCGPYHAHMVLPVKALPAEAFTQWLQDRQQPVSPAPQHETAVTAFKTHCGACHGVRGVTRGSGAPDLTSVGARPLLGGQGRAVERPIYHWLTHHRRAVDGTAIPDHSTMAPEHLKAIAAWLETLGHE